MFDFHFTPLQKSKVVYFSRNQLIALKQLLVLRLKHLSEFEHPQSNHIRKDYLAAGIKPVLPRGARARQASPESIPSGGGGTKASGRRALTPAKITGVSATKTKMLSGRMKEIVDKYNATKDKLSPAQRNTELAKVTAKIKKLQGAIKDEAAKQKAQRGESTKPLTKEEQEDKLIQETVAQPGKWVVTPKGKLVYKPLRPVVHGELSPIDAANRVVDVYQPTQRDASGKITKLGKYTEEPEFDLTTPQGRMDAREAQRALDKISGEREAAAQKKLADKKTAEYLEARGRRDRGEQTESEYEREQAEEASAGFFSTKKNPQTDKTLENFRALKPKAQQAARKITLQKTEEAIKAVLAPSNLIKMALNLSGAKTWGLSDATRQILGKDTVAKLVKETTAKVKEGLDAANMRLFKTTTPTSAQVEKIASVGRAQILRKKRAQENSAPQKRTEEQELAQLLDPKYRPPNNKTVDGQASFIRRLEDQTSKLIAKDSLSLAEQQTLFKLEKRIDNAKRNIKALPKGEVQGIETITKITEVKNALITQINKQIQIGEVLYKGDPAGLKKYEEGLKKSAEWIALDNLGRVMTGNTISRAAYEQIVSVAPNIAVSPTAIAKNADTPMLTDARARVAGAKDKIAKARAGRTG